MQQGVRGPTLSEAEQRFDALRRRIGLWAAPLSFAILWYLPFPSLDVAAHRLAAVATATVILWLTEAIPLAAAALLGPSVAVLVGVTDATTALEAFADPLIFLFMGGFLLAAGLSRQGFDQRAALWLISRPQIAGSPRRAVAALAAIAFGFSMWISNTATTAMLLPVALGLHATICRACPGTDAIKLQRFGGTMCLALAYAASLGGMATPIGTGPNVIALGMIEAEAGVEIDFLAWMGFALPVSLVLVVWMVSLMLRVHPPPVDRVEGLTAEVKRQLAELGPIRPGERRVLLVFGLAVAGWLTPAILRLSLGADAPLAAWAKASLEEGIVAMLCAVLLFVVPTAQRTETGSRRSVLEWSDAHEIDWGTLLLLGGGLALGKLTFETGLAEAIGEGVLDLAGPLARTPFGLMAVAVALVLFLTEVTSNTATTSMMLPVIIGIAKASALDVVPTAVGVTLAASCAFMLPVSTPPNAMAYGTGLLRIDSMVRIGFRLDLIALAVLLLAASLLVPWMLAGQ